MRACCSYLSLIRNNQRLICYRFETENLRNELPDYFVANCPRVKEVKDQLSGSCNGKAGVERRASGILI